MNNQYKATSVHECWTIAFNEAEECQMLMNKLTVINPEWHRLKNYRDMASLIAQKIKFGEKEENK